MNGTLMIVGGAMAPSLNRIFSELIRRAGGPQNKFAFVVSASGEDPDDTFRKYVADFVRLGVPAENCVLVPLYGKEFRDERGYNAFTGDADGLLELMEGVTGVWFTGGDQYYTNKCFIREDGSDTALLARLREIYAQGGVIGGSSAGAAIMSRVMIGTGNNHGALAHGPVFGYEDYDPNNDDVDGLCQRLRIVQGLGFFTEGVVDQHFNARPRLLRLIQACLSNKEGVRMGYAVSEDTCLLWNSGKLQVLGSAAVYLVDCRKTVQSGPGCFTGVGLSALYEGDSYTPATDTVELFEEVHARTADFYPDVVSNGIINSPMFDEMMDRRLLRGKPECLHRCPQTGREYVPGAVVYQIGDKPWLVMLKYYRANIRGYREKHTSFTGVELDVESRPL